MENIEIKLESSEDTTWISDEEKVSIDHVNFEFEQSSKLRGVYRKMSIFNDNQCYQSIRNKHDRKYRYRVDLSYLDPRPFREKKTAWNWLLGSMGLLLVSAALIYIGWFSGLSVRSANFEIAAIVVISAMLISFMLFIHKSYDKIIFKSQYGRVKFLEMLYKYPDKDSFRRFIKQFIKQVKTEQAKNNFTQSDLLSRELQQLRRLMNEDVISEEQYESGKALIFKHDTYQVSEIANK